MGGSCSSGLRHAMRNNDLETMERLLEDAGDGASDLINEDVTADCCLDWLDACCHGNHSPLHTAVQKQHVAMVTLLLRYGADVTASDISGNGPLHIAAACDHVELCELLVRYNADVNARNGQGETAAVHAITSVSCRARATTAALDFLIGQPQYDITSTDIHGNTLLHIAAAVDNVPACLRLIDNKLPDVSVTNNAGKTAQQLAKTNCAKLFQP